MSLSVCVLPSVPMNILAQHHHRTQGRSIVNETWIIVNHFNHKMTCWPSFLHVSKQKECRPPDFGTYNLGLRGICGYVIVVPWASRVYGICTLEAHGTADLYMYHDSISQCFPDSWGPLATAKTLVVLATMHTSSGGGRTSSRALRYLMM